MLKKCFLTFCKFCYFKIFRYQYSACSEEKKEEVGEQKRIHKKYDSKILLPFKSKLKKTVGYLLIKLLLHFFVEIQKIFKIVPNNCRYKCKWNLKTQNDNNEIAKNKKFEISLIFFC